MKYHFLSQLVLGIGSAATIACGSAGAAQQPEAAPHSHDERSGDEHSHAEEAPSTSPTNTASGDSAAPRQEGQALTPEELAAYESARPLFEVYCANCHTTRGGKSSPKALDHFSMDGYPFGGHHAAEITATIREVLGATGSKPTMPRDKPGAVKGEDLRIILSWADAYDRAHASSHTEAPQKHDHDGHKH